VNLTPIYTEEIKAKLKDSISKEVGKNIRKIRKSKGYSMEHLAHLLDSNRQNIYKIEHGLYCPTIATLTFIAKALNCDITEIVTLKDSV